MKSHVHPGLPTHTLPLLPSPCSHHHKANVPACPRTCSLRLANLRYTWSDHIGSPFVYLDLLPACTTPIRDEIDHRRSEYIDIDIEIKMLQSRLPPGAVDYYMPMPIPISTTVGPSRSAVTTAARTQHHHEHGHYVYEVEATPVRSGRISKAARTAAGLPIRRRISRACDQCNQLRTKCDGKLPCQHCIGMLDLDFFS